MILHRGFIDEDEGQHHGDGHASYGIWHLYDGAKSDLGAVHDSRSRLAGACVLFYVSREDPSFSPLS